MSTVTTGLRPPSIDALTSLRFFAAIYVVAFHFGAGYAQRSGWPEFIVIFLRNGWFGVSAFFVLSGFILTYTYRDGIGGPGALRAYAIARFSRIYPVYILALIVAAPFSLEQFDIWLTLKSLLLVQAWTQVASSEGYYWITPAWSLSVEVFFYFLFPGLLLLTRNLGKWSVWSGILIIGILMVYLETPFLRPGMHPRFELLGYVPLPACRMLEFFFGILLCRLFFLQTSRTAVSGVAVLGVVLCMTAVLSQAQSIAVQSSATCLVGAVIYMLATGGGWVSRALSVRWLVLLGAASYAIYILHWPLRDWVRVMVNSPPTEQRIYPFVVIGVSLLVYVLFEKPIRALIRNGAAIETTKANESHEEPTAKAAQRYE